jgi:hypothetical protein
MKGEGVDRDLFLNGFVTYDLTPGRGAVTPYLVGSIGVMWHRSQFGFGPNRPGLQTVWMRHAHGSGGLGFRARATDRFQLGAEARLGSELELTAIAVVTYRLR